MNYDEQCDAMLAAGREWVAANPDHKAKWKTVAGHRFPDSDDAARLYEAISRNVPGTSGNQVQMVLSALLDQ